ncbi:MAG: hypothetical protein HOV79_10180 [Hamadaea sp.]|nr:hypothetical protein [Hamadaea sp.]
MNSDHGRRLEAADLTSAVAAFAEVHEDAAASIEYHGKRGARIVLTAEGQALVVSAASVEAAREACDAASVPVDNGWERELADLARPVHDLWQVSIRQEMVR